MIKITLRPDQEKAVRKITHFKGRALLADEMRMGKTIIILQWLKLNPRIRPAVVVCPEIGKWHWEEKAKSFFGIRGRVLNGTIPPRKKPLHRSELYIINWDILSYWVKWLKRLKFKALLLDECHYMKNPTTENCKAVRKLVRKSLHHIIGIGGTPLKSRPDEMFTILNLIRPDKFPSHIKYAFRYCEPKRKPWGWEYKGANHTKELNRNLNAWCMIRELRSVALNEPPKKRRIVTLPLSNRQEYHEAENNFIRWLNRRSPSRAKKAKKAERLVKMGYLKRLAVTLKMPYAIEWIDDWLENHKGKLACFAIHKDIIKILKDEYEDICVVVDGSITGKKRHMAVKTFQTNKKIRLFIGNTHAAGTVIELSAAKAGVGIELDWTPGDVTQWEDRIYEQGSEKALRIYYLVAQYTIEHHLCKILQKKGGVLSGVLDGDKNKNDMKVFDMLERALKKGIRK